MKPDDVTIIYFIYLYHYFKYKINIIYFKIYIFSAILFYFYYIEKHKLFVIKSFKILEIETLILY